MKRSFCLSVFFSVYSTFSLFAAEDPSSERTPLLGHGHYNQDFGYNYSFVFDAPKLQNNSFFSKSVPLDKICHSFKAGNALGAEYAQLRKKGTFESGKQSLTYFENNTWVVRKAPSHSHYISKIYCGEPSRELATLLLSYELNKSKGGSKVDVEFWNRIQKIYPELLTKELALEFLIAELSHRTTYWFGVSQKNYNPDFVNQILSLYPSLQANVGTI